MMVFAVAVTAPAESGHLTFRGVQITGSSKAFISKIRRTGIYTNSSGMLKGVVGGWKSSSIQIGVNGQNQVCQVLVGFRFYGMDRWTTYRDCYYSLKNSLVRKYGNPSECKEHMPLLAVNNFLKMRCLKNGYATYCTVFNTRFGQVILNMQWEGGLISGRPVIFLGYYDAIGYGNGIRSDL